MVLSYSFVFFSIPHTFSTYLGRLVLRNLSSAFNGNLQAMSTRQLFFETRGSLQSGLNKNRYQCSDGTPMNGRKSMGNWVISPLQVDLWAPTYD